MLNTIDYKGKYWLKAIGPMNLWEERYGVKKLPAKYAPELLGISPDEIEIDEDDIYSYYKPNLYYKTWLSKRSIFLFESPEILNTIIVREGCNQEIHIRKFNKEYYDILVSNDFSNVSIEDECSMIFDMSFFITDGKEEQNEFYNITQECYDFVMLFLNRCDYLIENYKDILSDEMMCDLKFEYRCVKKIIERANVLKLHKFE